MRRIVASLAIAVTALGVAACGGDDAEPGALKEATLVLDFQPNAVHAGIYTALAEGYLADERIDLEVREPSASTDAPKLLAAGRADFAILDINDLAIARERGIDLDPVMPIARRPLAALIAADPEVGRPRDLEGRTVGVTGLPSDDAVLDSIVSADGGDPDRVERVTIGFDSVAALSAGRVAAATAFWNAEGVALRDLGVDTREFRVDEYGAPAYPELVLVSAGAAPETRTALTNALARGYSAVVEDPELGLNSLVSEVDGLDADTQSAQLDALLNAKAFDSDGRFEPGSLEAHAEWASRYGVVD